MPSPSVTRLPASGGPGSLRARLRLGAALVLGLLGALSLVLAVRLYFFPPTSAVVSAVVALGFALAALLYAVLTRAVIRRSRSGHILAAVVCAGGAVFSLSAAMQWPDWLALSANLAAFGLLLGSVPPKRSRP